MANKPNGGPSRLPKGFPNPFESLDPNVIEKLPKGTELIELSEFGSSFWSYIGRLDVRLPDGSPKSYLLKATPEDKGKGMSEGEFVSMSALHAVKPEFVPRPVAWGSYRDIPDMHFFLVEFLDLIDELPAPEHLAARLAGLHRDERAASPTGRFGFPARTWSGVVPRDNAWCDTWEEYFARELRARLALERTRRPPDPEMEALAAALLARVVPRLLRPLAVLRSARPVLVHGDLWNKNVALALDAAASGRRRPVIFDAGCVYAHNEYEIGIWTCTRYQFTQEHIDAYCRHFPPAEPKEDFADRALLYAMSMDLCASYVHDHDPSYRELAKRTMRYLLGKYPGGYEEWARSYLPG
ncbi:Fructosamine kinase-domain-containing protein [Biscogniauxia mediterranea]|nr:Fructosamine kinase-domain-containing protein [Biscogniauxia mediterranea]